MDETRYSSLSEEPFQWGAGHGGDSFAASDIYKQFFLDEDLQSQFTTLFAEVSSAPSSPNTSTEDSLLSCSSSQSRSPSAFSRYCHWPAAAENSNERGKCTRKRMWSWIMEKFECVEQGKKQERNLKRKLSPLKMEPNPTPNLQLQAQNSLPQLQAPAIQECQISRMEEAKSASHNHMIAERNRRYRERELKAELMSCIPAATLKKKDKNSVYQYTIDYIKELKQQVAVLQKSKDSAMNVEVSSSTLDDEVNKSETPCSSLGSMVLQEDGNLMRLCFDTSGSKAHIDLIDLLIPLQGMGFKVDSIHWKPETSSTLALTVHSTMNPNQISGSQLCEILEQKLFSES